MMPVPSRLFLACLAGGVVGTLVLLAFPGAGLIVLAYFLVILATALLDLIITPRAGVLRATREAPERYSLQTAQTIRIKVFNRSRAALNIRLRDAPPESFQREREEVAGTATGSGETVWEYEVRPNERGSFSWGGIHGRYDSLLGFWELPFLADVGGTAKVYPNLEAVEQYHLLARTNMLDALGVRQVRLRGGNAAFESLRDYTRGDDARLIDWKATARRGKLIVQNQRPEKNQTVLLLVDSGRLMNAETGGVSKLDHAVNTALLLSHVALSRGDRVGVCTFSSEIHGWLPPRHSTGQQRLITDLLFDLRGDFSESDHGRCLRLLSVRHQKRALVVLLTDFVDTQTAKDMIDYLHETSRRHLVLFVALKDPFLDRAASGLVETEKQGFRKAAAVELLHERMEVLQRLRQMGIHVIDADPSSVTPPVLNRYLEIAFRGLL